jgi:hypothetical protein
MRQHHWFVARLLYVGQNRVDITNHRNSVYGLLPTVAPTENSRSFPGIPK